MVLLRGTGVDQALGKVDSLGTLTQRLSQDPSAPLTKFPWTAFSAWNVLVCVSYLCHGVRAGQRSGLRWLVVTRFRSSPHDESRGNALALQPWIFVARLHVS